MSHGAGAACERNNIATPPASAAKVSTSPHGSAQPFAGSVIGTLVASGFIAGEAITGILLAVLFIKGVPSLTRVVTGREEFPFLASWGGYLSLIVFAAIAYCLIQVPLRQRGGASEGA